MFNNLTIIFSLAFQLINLTYGQIPGFKLWENTHQLYLTLDWTMFNAIGFVICICVCMGKISNQVIYVCIKDTLGKQVLEIRISFQGRCISTIISVNLYYKVLLDFRQICRLLLLFCYDCDYEQKEGNRVKTDVTRVLISFQFTIYDLRLRFSYKIEMGLV